MNKIRCGYTLVELAVTLAVMAIIAAIVFSGFRPSGSSEKVLGAQRELIGNLRAAVNNVSAGNNVTGIAGSVSTISGRFVQGANTYILGGKTYTLPSPVTLSVSNGATVNLCFFNPFLTGSSPNALCPCTDSFVCDSSGISLSSPVVLTLTADTYQRVVQLDGAGMMVRKIYEP